MMDKKFKEVIYITINGQKIPHSNGFVQKINTNNNIDYKVGGDTPNKFIPKLNINLAQRLSKASYRNKWA